MTQILMEVLEAFLTGGASIFDGFSQMILFDVVFRVENQMGATNLSFTSILGFFVDYAIVISIIKFSKKIFFIYVGWTDGDVTDNPQIFLVNFIKAIAVMLSVGSIYDFIVRLTREIVDGLSHGLNIPNVGSLISIVTNPMVNTSIFTALAMCIYLIGAILLYIQFMKRGLEVFVLRVGFPLACIGLIDSDNGAFSPYIKLFMLNSFTTIVQIIVLKISFLLVQDVHIIWGLGALFMALNTPKFLQQYMVQVFDTPSAGGVVKSVGNGVSTVVSIAKKLIV